MCCLTSECADETIITWSDAEIGTDVALSFQEAGGCDTVWYVSIRIHMHEQLS